VTRRTSHPNVGVLPADATQSATGIPYGTTRSRGCHALVLTPRTTCGNRPLIVRELLLKFLAVEFERGGHGAGRLAVGERLPA
jgi:hypothetical protein